MRLGTGELLLILLIVMLVFGASRVSELGKGLGQGMKSFRDALKGGDEADKDGANKGDPKPPPST